MNKTSIALLAVLALAFGAVGCGGSPAAKTVTEPVSAPARAAAPATMPADAPPPGLTHDALIGKVNAVCADFNGYVANLLASPRVTGMAASDTAGLADLLAEVLKRSAGFTADLAALTPSAADRGSFARYLTSVKRQDGMTKRRIAALRDGDTDSANVLQRSQQANVPKRITAAIDLGADKCGHP